MRLQKIIIATLLVSVTASTAEGLFITADADGYIDGSDISIAFSCITLYAIGAYEGLDGKVYARTTISEVLASTGTNAFGHSVPGSDTYGNPKNETWLEPHTILKAEFSNPANWVSIDIIGNNSSDYGVLEAYSSGGTLLDSIRTPSLSYGQIYVAEINRSSFDIAYITATGDSPHTVHLDHLCVNVIPEPGMVLLLSLGGLALLRKRRK